MTGDKYNSSFGKLMEYMENMKTIDTHEHLPAEKDRLAQKVDFFTLFSHYCVTDLLTSGMSRETLNKLMVPSDETEAKWNLFKPYYDMIHDGSYAHSARIAMERFYGMDDIDTLDDANKLTEAMRAANTEGLYKRVIADACGIQTSLNFGGPASEDGLILHVPFMDELAETPFRSIRGLEDKFNISCSSLDKYLSAVRAYIEELVKNGAKGLKFAIAYARDLDFSPATKDEAEKAFNRIADEGYGRRDAALGYNERRPLMNYMVHRICEIAGEMEVPVIFHSAMQADIMHNADDARPIKLWNLPHRHRKTNFVLLHSGFPWMEDGAMLCKHFPNLYLDMTWAHLMSPDITARILGEWIDLIPVHKIMGFGGDYCVVEKIYGHLTLARRSIATALANKISLGDLSMHRAEVWMQSILHDNAARIYKI